MRWPCLQKEQLVHGIQNIECRSPSHTLKQRRTHCHPSSAAFQSPYYPTDYCSVSYQICSYTCSGKHSDSVPKQSSSPQASFVLAVSHSRPQAYIPYTPQNIPPRHLPHDYCAPEISPPVSPLWHLYPLQA